jgi:hypothetical protein
MKSVALNLVFVAGLACIIASAFIVALPLGLFVLGCPLIAISVHIQRRAAAK